MGSFLYNLIGSLCYLVVRLYIGQGGNGGQFLGLGVMKAMRINPGGKPISCASFECEAAQNHLHVSDELHGGDRLEDKTKPSVALQCISTNAKISHYSKVCDHPHVCSYRSCKETLDYTSLSVTGKTKPF